MMSPRRKTIGPIAGALLLLGTLGLAPSAAHTESTPAPPPPEAVADAPTETGGAAVDPAAEAPSVPRFLTVPPEKLTPMQREIRLRIEQEQRELAALAAAYAVARSDDEALALQRQVHAVKLAAERAVLQIQLDWARLEARADVVVQLEQAIAALDGGSPIRQRADRPAGDAAPR